jgi:SET domain-containing protein
MYRPLPDGITIGESSIQGLGLFATKRITQGTLIGIVHHVHEHSENGVIRTPLGGFGNHSDNPNCSKLMMEDGSWWIVANQDIKTNEEITWKYSLYSVEENNGD